MRSLDFTRLFTARKKIVFYRQLVRFLLENTHDCFGFLFSLIISGSLLLTIPVRQAGPMGYRRVLEARSAMNAWMSAIPVASRAQAPSPMWAASSAVALNNSLYTGRLECHGPTSVQALQALVGGVRTKVTALSQSGAIAGSVSAQTTPRCP